MSALDRWAELLPTVNEVRRVDGPGPITVGSRFLVRQPGLAAATYQVTDWRPEAGFTWAARTAGVRTTATHVLHPEGDTTRLQLRIDWDGPGSRLVRVLFARRTRRLLEQEAATFASLAERGHGEV
ncbi:Polyketide cyclase / dehydrase and lipid transport [Micromonospora phaseoli]|uniref:Polyketide cyclase / dehydrase and lipid transport n=1 Tax=Micromonospora phaseoli TaxID=1144548 RepID=A0A1H6YRT4_9ACTN|nr:hypothetical protein Xph01_12730 [Micromonospora phaseoli]SEJ43959.1 Polyketide cyclase / dehydrase and lipid transport [Micromonospora phaseoli]